MNSRRVARFELVILKPLGILALLAMLFFLFQRAWAVALVMFFAWMFIGAIGQSLHKDLSFRQLSNGTPLPRDYPAGGGPISSEEAYSVAKPLMLTAWVIIPAVAVILFHYGLKFYFAIPLAIGIGLAVMVVGAVVAAHPRA